MSQAAFENWVAAYRRIQEEGTGMMWPSETLIRLFKGPYVPATGKKFQGKKVLEVGFGNANNLVFLGTLGMSLYGVEIKADLCDAVREKLAGYGLRADLREGTNLRLPFTDNEFDFLVSWNVLHYENTEKNILAGLREYARVLKPNGRFFLSTTGPEHKILNGATKVGPHRYQIGRDDDFRKGEIYFYFDSAEYIHHYFSQCFREIQVGRTHDFFFTETLDWFIVTGIK